MQVPSTPAGAAGGGGVGRPHVGPHTAANGAAGPRVGYIPGRHMSGGGRSQIPMGTPPANALRKAHEMTKGKVVAPDAAQPKPGKNFLIREVTLKERFQERQKAAAPVPALEPAKEAAPVKLRLKRNRHTMNWKVDHPQGAKKRHNDEFEGTTEEKKNKEKKKDKKKSNKREKKNKTAAERDKEDDKDNDNGKAVEQKPESDSDSDCLVIDTSFED